jgi:Double-GTPase 2
VSRRADRLCPYCGADVWLASCDVVATNVETSHATGWDAPESVPGSEGDITVPSGSPVLGYRGSYPVIWKPQEVPAPQPTRGGWLALLTRETDTDLIELDDLPPEDLPRRACTTCETPLPADLDDRDAHVLAVVGLNGAGKTHYLAAALTEATRKRGLTVAGCTEFSADEDTATRLHRDYYTRLFRNGELFVSTQVDQRVADKPLTFRTTFTGTDPFLLMTHDISGEVLSDHRLRASVTPFLRRASAVIFLVDPLEFDAVRERLPRSALPPARNIHQADLLSACLRELQYTPGGEDVPVALTISKSDVLSSLFGAEYAFARAGATDGWVEDVQGVSDEVRKLLLTLGETELVATAETHSRVTFHAVSALGSMPTGPVLDHPQPRRCIDPLGAVLMRLSHALS